MKKTLLTGVMVLASIFMFAGIVEQTYFFNNQKITKSGEYHFINFENLFLTGKTGEPVLPYQAVKILLPPGQSATMIEIITENEISLPGTYKLFPQQPSRPLSEPGNGQFYLNETIYAKEGNYPAKQNGELTTGYLNGYSIAMSSFTPVKYKPASGEISYYQQVKVRIHTVADASSSEALKNISHTNAAMYRIANFVENPNVAKQYPKETKSENEYELLIITTNQFESDFGELVTFYTNRGLKVNLVTKETITGQMTGQDDQEKIRNFIIQEYQDNNAQFVILGGDVEHIPYRGFFCHVDSGSGYDDSDIPADLYYSALDGNWNDDGDNKWGEIGEDDLLPEIAVARFPFSNSSELANMINKTTLYQNDPVLGEFNNVTMAGEWLYSNPDTWGSDYLELLIGHSEENGYETWGIPEYYNFNKLYEINQSWGGNELMAEINAGRQFIHHVGHANSNYTAHLYNSDITNANFSGANGVDHNFTLMQSHGCICGAFDDNDCIMEKMVTIENFAVAVIGNSRYGWFNEGQTEGPSQHLHREMMDAIYHEKMNMIGAAFVESKIQTAPWVTAPGQWEEGALRWNFYDINILGDPALSLWTEEPITINTDHLGVLFMGETSYDVNVTSEGLPKENFHCAIIYEGVVYGSGLTDADGNLSIELEPIPAPGDAQLVVTGYNSLPNTYDVSVTPAGPTFVHYVEHTVNDVAGNNNGLLDFGESVTLDMTLENIGTEQAENVETELSTASPYITLTGSIASFGNIGSNATLTITDAFAFEIAEDIPDQETIEFELLISWNDDEQSLTNIFVETANAPALTTGSVMVNDTENGNGNGLLDAGETVEIMIEASNEGHCACDLATASLASVSQYVEIITATSELGVINSGETKQATFTIEVANDTPEGTSVDLDYIVEAGSYTAQQMYFLSVGLIFEDFESGDFTAFDWEMEGDADWTITTSEVYEGTYAAKSGAIDDQSTSELVITMDVAVDDQISFYKKVSSEADYDYLRFFIDNIEMGSWAGEVGWEISTFDVSEGTHIFKWVYEKDYSVNSGDDCAWLDYIVFPGLIPPVSVQEKRIKELNIYPNPANHYFTIEYSLAKSTAVSVSIINKLGQIVKSMSNASTQGAGFYKLDYNIADLEAGIYLVRISTGFGTITKKLIISK